MYIYFLEINFRAEMGLMLDREAVKLVERFLEEFKPYVDKPGTWITCPSPKLARELVDNCAGVCAVAHTGFNNKSSDFRDMFLYCLPTWGYVDAETTEFLKNVRSHGGELTEENIRQWYKRQVD